RAGTIAGIGPAVVAFVGSTADRQCSGPAASAGPGRKPERIGGATVFVVPNPSGRNAAYPGFGDKLVWYRRLRRWTERSSQPGKAGPLLYKRTTILPTDRVGGPDMAPHTPQCSSQPGKAGPLLHKRPTIFPTRASDSLNLLAAGRSSKPKDLST